MPRFYKYLVIVEYKKTMNPFTIFANNEKDLFKRLYLRFPEFKKLKKDKIKFEKYYK